MVRAAATTLTIGVPKRTKKHFASRFSRSMKNLFLLPFCILSLLCFGGCGSQHDQDAKGWASASGRQHRETANPDRDGTDTASGSPTVASVPKSSSAEPKSNQKRATFDQVFWQPGDKLDFLYLVITNPKDEPVPQEAVAARAKAALEIARRHQNRPRPFNIVFFVQQTPDDPIGAYSGFSIEQLEELAAAAPEIAKGIVLAHHWSLSPLPTRPYNHDEVNVSLKDSKKTKATNNK